jgi:hypothetical protein
VQIDVRRLLNAMAADSSAEVRLSTPVAAIDTTVRKSL